MPQVIEEYELHPIRTLRNEARKFADTYDKDFDSPGLIALALGSLRDSLLAYYEHLERTPALDIKVQMVERGAVAETFHPTQDGV